jgi:hypothetical protein
MPTSLIDRLWPFANKLTSERAFAALDVSRVPAFLELDLANALCDSFQPLPGAGLTAAARLLSSMASHYGVGILPARPRKPRDKATVSYRTLFG